ncbi:MAG: YkgJ family cysteine cluster protein [Campylobacterales bacterium]|nr:YkgJ family cysteine cluster protein [Campylobacterales bacterium]
MSDLMKQNGFPYAFDPKACETCEGRCCTGESGYIYVTKEEIFAIAELLNMDVNDFAIKYLFQKGYKYSIRENKIGDSYECVFYDRKTNGCQIYLSRPKQCRTFPFWDYFKTRVDELKEECPGIVDV